VTVARVLNLYDYAVNASKGNFLRWIHGVDVCVKHINVTLSVPVKVFVEYPPFLAFWLYETTLKEEGEQAALHVPAQHDA
jgi:hypothetical protein